MSFFRRLFGFQDKKTVTEAPLPAPQLPAADKLEHARAQFLAMQASHDYFPPSCWEVYPKLLQKAGRFDEAARTLDWLLSQAETLVDRDSRQQDDPLFIRKGEIHHWRKLIYETLRIVYAREGRKDDAEHYESLRVESKAAYENFLSQRDAYHRQQIKEGVVTTSAFDMHFDNEAELYAQAAEWVLAGSSLDKSMRLDLALSSRGGNNGAVRRLLGEKDFDWPWYDEWYARFSEMGRFPDSSYALAWQLPSAPITLPYTSMGAVLSSLTIAQLRELAVSHGITLTKSAKKDKLCQTIASSLRWEDVIELANAKNAEHERKERLARIRAKQDLLCESLTMRFHNLLRHGQIGELLADNIVPRRPRLEHDAGNHDEWIVGEIIAKWKFDPSDISNLPPFFPGDHTTLGTEKT
ncbi:hypothetical protein AGMMS50256_36250 [Betaproteobacteria bacterium]|nr:hypothetical protein AGMMS50256_36250 [Betaproteobacteria bacterium]